MAPVRMRTPNVPRRNSQTRRARTRTLPAARTLVLAAAVGAGLSMSSPFWQPALATEPDAAGTAELGAPSDGVFVERRPEALAGGIEAIKSRDEALSELRAQVATLASEVAALRQESTSLQAAQKDGSLQVDHIRADLADAQVGLASLRASIDDHEANRRSLDAALDSRLARLTQQAASLRAAQSDTATELAPMRAALASAQIGLESLHAGLAQHRDATTSSTAASPAPHRRVSRILTEWSVQDGQKGRAVVSGDRHVYAAVPGTVLPGLGRVTELRRQDSRWIVVTEKGLIVQR